MQESIDINQKLVKESGSSIRLGQESYLPHISLLMGGMDTSIITEVNELLTQIGHSFRPLSLIIKQLRTKYADPDTPITELVIEKNNQLQHLHERIVGKLRPYLNYDITRDMFVPNGNINKFTIQWVSKFITQSSFDNFEPHITLGIGEMTAEDRSTPFQPASLALCQLGNYCTCAEVIFKIDMKGKKES
jgi:hypothetical protein